MLPEPLRTAAELAVAAAATAALLAVTLLCATAARADGSPSGPPGGGSGSGPRRGPPPPEALAACEKLASGAACSFTHDGHQLTGVCWAPEDRPLACKPDRPPHEGGSGSGSGPRR
jgi:hypothetical protein